MASLDQVGLLILPHLFYKLMAWSKRLVSAAEHVGAKFSQELK